MRYAFFGSPRFAEIVLSKLIESGRPPDLVVTSPDALLGRKQVPTSPPAKVLAEKHGLPVFQPKTLKNFPNQPQEYSPITREPFDFFVIAAYAKIIPKEILALPRLGVVGVHPSLLPLYRGPSPIQSAILAGEEYTGVSLFLTDEDVDHGPILEIADCQSPITNSGYLELEEKLAELGGKSLAEIIPKFIAGKIKPEQQNHTAATFTRKFTTADGEVNEDELKNALDGSDPNSAAAIHRKILALNPDPGVWVEASELRLKGFAAGDKRIKLLASEFKNGKLYLKKIQVAGKNPVELR